MTNIPVRYVKSVYDDPVYLKVDDEPVMTCVKVGETTLPNGLKVETWREVGLVTEEKARALREVRDLFDGWQVDWPGSAVYLGNLRGDLELETLTTEQLKAVASLVRTARSGSGLR